MSQVKVFYWRDGQLARLQDNETELRNWVLLALKELNSRYKEFGWAEVVEPEEVIEYVMQEHFFCWVGSTLAAFQIARPWFSKEHALIEAFVVPFGTTPTLADVDAALVAIAKAAKVRRIVTGTRAAPRGKHAGLGRKYEQLGYSFSTIEMTKVIE